MQRLFNKSFTYDILTSMESKKRSPKVKKFLNTPIEEAAKASVLRYKETYRLLAKYGESKKGAPVVADPENVAEYFREV